MKLSDLPTAAEIHEQDMRMRQIDAPKRPEKKASSACTPEQ